jgi:hypothetical protein
LAGKKSNNPFELRSEFWLPLEAQFLRSAGGDSGASKRHVTTVLRVTGLNSRPLWSILRASLPRSRPWLQLAGEAPLLTYRSRSREKVCRGSLQPKDLGGAPQNQSYGGLEPICSFAPQQRSDYLRPSLWTGTRRVCRFWVILTLRRIIASLVGFQFRGAATATGSAEAR